ncbi:cysteine proteinase inhibitor 6-like [Oryza brachyantha]|uniref:Cysteine proteinase inhibitor n=1 Tax=Oryza brachyantha TaxID=4533 RepID=J3LLA3_ORYBR|nr:cysteine proteinase inhibitor 6-like [Oryza brachyantha]
MRTISLLLLAAAVAIVAAVCAAPAAAAIAGGWTPINDIDDWQIQGLGRWAVSENNRRSPSGDALTFLAVTGGEQQVVAGVNYRLDIDASSSRDGIGGSYKAVLFEGLGGNTRRLISFEKNHS